MPGDGVTCHHDTYSLPRLSPHPLLQRIILPFEGHCLQAQEIYLAI